jgi:hypothetical protein
VSLHERRGVADAPRLGSLELVFKHVVGLPFFPPPVTSKVCTRPQSSAPATRSLSAYHRSGTTTSLKSRVGLARKLRLNRTFCGVMRKRGLREMQRCDCPRWQRERNFPIVYAHPV